MMPTVPAGQRIMAAIIAMRTGRRFLWSPQKDV
jgi:hypothetical protein